MSQRPAMMIEEVIVVDEASIIEATRPKEETADAAKAWDDIEYDSERSSVDVLKEEDESVKAWDVEYDMEAAGGSKEEKSVMAARRRRARHQQVVAGRIRHTEVQDIQTGWVTSVLRDIICITSNIT